MVYIHKYSFLATEFKVLTSDPAWGHSSERAIVRPAPHEVGPNVRQTSKYVGCSVSVNGGYVRINDYEASEAGEASAQLGHGLWVGNISTVR